MPGKSRQIQIPTIIHDWGRSAGLGKIVGPSRDGRSPSHARASIAYDALAAKPAMPGPRIRDMMITERLDDIQFPARDRPLARTVADLSEPEPGRAADNLITNEDSFARVAAEVARRVPAGGVYLGVGPDQNLTYVAHGRPRLGFVLDFRRRNALLHLVHKALLMLASDRAGYLARLLARAPGALADDPSADDLVAAFARPAMDRARLDAAIAAVAATLAPTGLVRDDEWPALATIQARLAGPGLEGRFLALPMYPTLARLVRSRDRDGRPAHFLARDDWYQAVRAAQVGDRILPITGDFAGDGALPRLAAWLHRRALPVSLLYLSDVEFFLLRSGRFPAFAANLARLPWLEGAALIRTSTREIPHPERAPGDSSTTILRPVAPFLDAALAGKIRTLDDLFV